MGGVVLADAIALLRGGEIDIGGAVVTAAEIDALKAAPWGDLAAALKARLGSLDADALAVEEVVAIAGHFGFVAAPLVVVAIKVVVLAFDDGTQHDPGALAREGDSRKGSDPQIPDPGAGA